MSMLGFYQCSCGEAYISDFAYEKCFCLECGNVITVEILEEAELNGALYNLDIMTVVDEGLSWTQIAEFLHYLSVVKARMIVEYLREKEYISYDLVRNKVGHLKVHRLQVDAK